MTLQDWTNESPERRRELAVEYLQSTTAREIWECMESREVSRSRLAELLGKTKAFVSQVLTGERNLTLRSLAEIADALDSDVDIRFVHRVSAAKPERGGVWHFERGDRRISQTQSVTLAIDPAHVAANEHSGTARQPVYEERAA